ncbi:hypothetical protein [Micromonospora sp. NPDC049645]|uniref:hypothetical protein n=1 Tax=Micromonospora sp. NPDC049645 TaxID=3155508 RepID=UPI003417A2B9
MTGDVWECEAYGPGGVDVGALCFVAGDLGDRVCADAAECGARMAPERVRLFERLGELSAVDPTYAAIADGITSPEQLLGGPRSDELLDDEPEPHDSDQPDSDAEYLRPGDPEYAEVVAELTTTVVLDEPEPPCGSLGCCLGHCRGPGGRA